MYGLSEVRSVLLFAFYIFLVRRPERNVRGFDVFPKR